MSTPTFRFAPSLDGYLHLGHACSALLNFAMARAAGGRLLLRIEDIGASRCQPYYEAAICEDLKWLDIAWEQPVCRQSEHLDDYRAASRTLAAAGLVYPSFESRAEIACLVAARGAVSPRPRDPDGVPLYPGAARRTLGGDVVLARKDVPTSYPLSVVVDDAAQGVNVARTRCSTKCCCADAGPRFMLRRPGSRISSAPLRAAPHPGHGESGRHK
jgi:glutamyl/glutaminyl-tRNA synthetase